MSALVFWLLAITTMGFGWRYSSGTDRILVAAVGASVAATAASGLGLPPANAYWAVLAVDCSLALFAIGVALRSFAYWPIWFAAFASLGALTGITNSLMASEYWLFRMLAGFWAIPALLALLLGSLRDGRAGLTGALRAKSSSLA